MRKVALALACLPAAALVSLLATPWGPWTPLLAWLLVALLASALAAAAIPAPAPAPALPRAHARDPPADPAAEVWAHLRTARPDLEESR